MRTSTIGHEHHPIRPASQPYRVSDIHNLLRSAEVWLGIDDQFHTTQFAQTPGEDSTRWKKEAGPAAYSARLVGRHAHDAMDMRMVVRVQPPGVKHGYDAKLRPEVFGVGCDRGQPPSPILGSGLAQMAQSGTIFSANSSGLMSCTRTLVNPSPTIMFESSWAKIAAWPSSNPGRPARQLRLR